jgi:hypothetical protein
VLQPQAKINHIEHAEGEVRLTVQGENLKRIASIEVEGRGGCTPEPDTITDKPMHMSFVCEGSIRHNAGLPETVQIIHMNDEPGPLSVKLTPTAAIPRLTLAGNTPNALLVTPSEKGRQWNLLPSGVLMSEDSGLNLLLQAESPYVLSKGNYVLELRFKDDPETAAHPLSAPLIADFSHNELRTRSPVRFDPTRLPSVINSLEFRVQHKPTAQAGAWQSLGRTLIWLPDLQSLSCSSQGDALFLQGQRLDLIDAIQIPSSDNAASKDFVAPKLVPCSNGLCLQLPPVIPGNQILVRMRWVDDSVFTVTLPKSAQVCP